MSDSCPSITVVTATLGESGRRVETLCRELRQFTELPFDHVVIDDGTKKEYRQAEVCKLHGAKFVPFHGDRNFLHGPAIALNAAVDGYMNDLNEEDEWHGGIGSDWIAIIEDAVRPSQGWLESAVDFINHSGLWLGMFGCTLVQDWMLAAAGMFGDDVTAMDVFRNNVQYQDHFYGDWNDGTITWGELAQGMRAGGLLNQQVEREVGVLARGLLRTQAIRPNPWSTWDGDDIVEQQQNFIKFRPNQRWPNSSFGHQCTKTPYPGPICFIRRAALEDVGGFSPHCTFWEGHLGVRMMRRGWKVCAIETPPFFHTPSQCFSWYAHNQDKAAPRAFLNSDDVFRRDFGGDYREVGRDLLESLQ